MVVRPRQIEVLRYIALYRLQRGTGPTGREIAAEFGWTQGTEQFHLAILRRAEYLRRTPGAHRDVRVTDSGYRVLETAAVAKSIGHDIGIDFGDEA